MRDKIASVRALAYSKCYELKRATVKDCFRLVHEITGVAAKAPSGSTAFTLAEARAFLLECVDA